MAKADEKKVAEGAAQRYNPHTAQWEPLDDPDMLAEHEAQIEGKPAPGDRTAEELKLLDGGAGAPTLTTDQALDMTGESTIPSGGAGGATGGATGATGASGETGATGASGKSN